MSSLSDQPLISIVVPFYNIERCVDYCLESLLGQTYSNYEIVCVDDGSTDGTGKLLDAYSSNPKVVVHHKENGGLSDARNYGVQVAHGELITFVDGDDVVAPHYLETLAGCLDGTKGMMVVGCSRCISEAEAKRGCLQWDEPTSCKRFAKSDVLLKYMYEEILPGAWCRLAPRELYLDRSFPKGVYYEEIRTAAGFVADSKSIAITESPIYGYVMREGSIVHRKQVHFKQLENYFDAIDAFESMASTILDRGDKAYVHFKCLHYSRIFRLMNAVVDTSEEVGELRLVILETIRSNLRTLLTDKRVSKGNKARFAILSLLPGLYEKCFEIYENRRNKAMESRAGE